MEVIMNDELPKVVMSSAEYGSEDFTYDTIEEAREGFERLKKKCAKSFKKDGIERRLLLVIDDWETKA
jgi:hypothetical protein